MDTVIIDTNILYDLIGREKLDMKESDCINYARLDRIANSMDCRNIAINSTSVYEALARFRYNGSESLFMLSNKNKKEVEDLIDHFMKIHSSIWSPIQIKYAKETILVRFILRHSKFDKNDIIDTMILQDIEKENYYLITADDHIIKFLKKIYPEKTKYIDRVITKNKQKSKM